MDRKLIEEKKQDYNDLMESASYFMEEFKNYTPDQRGKLDEITNSAMEKSNDLVIGPKFFKLLNGYIRTRYEELEEYRIRRAKYENEFFQDLPSIFEKLVLEEDELKKCKALNEITDKHQHPDNYNLLLQEVIKLIVEE